jgi:hypothetical protein
MVLDRLPYRQNQCGGILSIPSGTLHADQRNVRRTIQDVLQKPTFSLNALKPTTESMGREIGEWIEEELACKDVLRILTESDVQQLKRSLTRAMEYDILTQGVCTPERATEIKRGFAAEALCQRLLLQKAHVSGWNGYNLLQGEAGEKVWFSKLWLYFTSTLNVHVRSGKDRIMEFDACILDEEGKHGIGIDFAIGLGRLTKKLEKDVWHFPPLQEMLEKEAGLKMEKMHVVLSNHKHINEPVHPPKDIHVVHVPVQASMDEAYIAIANRALQMKDPT